MPNILNQKPNSSTMIESNQLSSILDVLPLELLPRVMLQLDLFSMRSLFEADTLVAKHCIFIEVDDEEERQGYVSLYRPKVVPPPFHNTFFDSCQCLRNVRESNYNPITNRAQFRIFSTHYIPGDVSQKPNIAEFFTRHLQYFDKGDSILNYAVDMYISQPENALLKDHLLSAFCLRNGYTLYISSEVNHDRWNRIPELMIHSLDDLYVANHTPMSPLQIREAKCMFPLEKAFKSLTIEGVENVESLSFSDSLIKLTIIFGKSFSNPVVRNIKLGGSRCDLYVYYEDKVPLIQGLQWPPLKEVQWPKEPDGEDIGKRMKNRFVLGHIPSLSSSLTEPLPMHPDEGSDFGYLTPILAPPSLNPLFQCDPFFLHIEVIGGPTGLITTTLVLRPQVFSLFLKQTSPELDMTKPAFLVQGQSFYFSNYNFKFESLLPNVQCPIHAITKGLGCGSYSRNSISIIAHHGLHLTVPSRYQAHPRNRSAWKFYQFLIHVNTKGSEEMAPSMKDLKRLFKDGKTLRLSLRGLKKSAGVDEERLQRRMGRRLEEGTYSPFWEWSSEE